MNANSNHNRKTIQLHMELVSGKLDKQEVQILHELGKVKTAISRDVLVPSSITLHALHYLIQRLFGWQNSHLHSFELPEKTFMMLTGGMFARWGELCGIFFQMPDAENEDIFWDDDYDGRKSFRSWLRQKYNGPYHYDGYSELYLSCQKELLEFYKRWPKVDILIPFDQIRKNPNASPIAKAVSPRKATIQEVFRSIDMGGDEFALLERLTLADIMVLTGEDVPTKADTPLTEAFPVTKELKYIYDYGDNWEINISIVQDSTEAARHPEVAELEKPLCIMADGLNVMDDVGGIHGYCELLQSIHWGDPAERADMRSWAKMQGWTGRFQKPENIL